MPITLEEMDSIAKEVGFKPAPMKQSRRERLGIDSMQPKMNMEAIDFESLKNEGLGGFSEIPRQATDLPDSEIPKSYSDDFRGDVTKRVDTVKKTLASDQDIGTKALNVAGNVAGGVGDLAYRGIEAVGDMLGSIGPQRTDEEKARIKEYTKTFALPGEDKVKELVGKGVNMASDAWKNYEAQFPEDAQRIKDVFALASFIPAEKVASVGVKGIEKGVEAGTDIAQKALQTTSDFVSETVENSKKALKNNKSQRSLETAIEIGRPQLTKEMEAQAFKQGRLKDKGVLQKRTVAPSTDEIKIGEALQPLVEEGRLGKDALRNGEEISKEVSRINSGVKEFLNEPRHNSPVDMNDLGSYLDDMKAENNILFGGDKAIEQAYDSVIEEYKRFVKNKTVAGVFDGRQGFDAFIRNKYPNMFKPDKFGNLNPIDNAKKHAVYDIRRAANEYVASMLDDNAAAVFKNALQKESYMLQALENIAQKEIMGTTDKNAIMRMIDKHPWLKIAIPSGLAGAYLTN